MNNFNEAELNKFNQLSQEWWDPKGPLKTLHQINPLRLQFVLERQTDTQDKTLLDMGCGGGIFTEALSEHYGATIGLDMADDLIAVARAHATPLHQPPEYLIDNAENYAKTHMGAFDVITCMEMLEHVPEPAAIIQALSAMLKPGGSLFCSTLNRTLSSYVQAIVGAEYILGLLPKGTHDYQAFIRPSELVEMARQAGLVIQTLKGVQYNLFTQTFSLSDNINVNYLAHFTKAGKNT